MLDPFSVATVTISVSALALSLYREFEGPEISVLSNRPVFKLTDRFFYVSDQSVPQWFQSEDSSLVFANYGGKAGTIMGIKMDFEPKEVFKEFLQGFPIYDQSTPITLEKGQNYIMKLSPSIRTIDWKRQALINILKENDQETRDCLGKAENESKNNFQRFISCLSQNKSLGKVTITISLTTGRLRTKVRNKILFQKLDITNEYDKTIEQLSKYIQNWHLLEPSRSQLLQEYLSAPLSLMFELNSVANVLGKDVDQQNISSSIIITPNWDNFVRGKAFNDGVASIIIDKESMRGKIEGFYKNLTDYNTRIRELLYPVPDHTPKDYEKLNEQRAVLFKEAGEILDWLKSISSPQRNKL